ncbi:MAG: c-type cytochrome [bacterium]
MKKILLVLLSLSAFACGDSADSSTTTSNNTAGNNTIANNSTGGPGDVAAGADLYIKYCQVCHGPEGTGAAVWPGNIQGIDPIYGIVHDGRGQMAPVPATDPEIADIQAYLNSFGVDLSSLMASNCTRANARAATALKVSTTQGPIIQFAVPGFAKWVTRNGREGLGFPGPMTAYGTDRVTDTQLDEIIDFLHAQERPATGVSLYVTFCSNCHGMDGRSGTTGVNILGETPSEKIREGEGGTNYGSRRGYMPAWSTADMSNEEVALITAFINTL